MGWKFKRSHINNCPTRCNTKQSSYYSASSLYMFRVSNTPIIRSTQNCNYSLLYWSYFLCSYLPPTWPSLATLWGGRWPVPEAVVTVLCTHDDGCGWHPKHVEWSLATLDGGSCTKIWPVPEAVVTVLCTHDDGCGWHPKHVEWSLATLDGGSCTKNMTSTGGCSYSFVYSWWWVWLTPETCRVKLGYVGRR